MSKAVDIKTKLLQLLEQGAQKLPAERELSTQFSTTRVTIREALKLLESEGKIYRANRSGWFLSPARLKYDPALHAKKSFMVIAEEQGFTPHSKVVNITHRHCDARLALIMQTSQGKPLIGIDRLRYLDDRPVLLEKMLFRADLIPELDRIDLQGSIHQYLRETLGLAFGEVQSDITASCLTGEDALELQAFEGASALKLERTYANDTGEIFEYDIEMWRGDALRIELNSQL